MRSPLRRAGEVTLTLRVSEHDLAVIHDLADKEGQNDEAYAAALSSGNNRTHWGRSAFDLELSVIPIVDPSDSHTLKCKHDLLWFVMPS